MSFVSHLKRVAIALGRIAQMSTAAVIAAVGCAEPVYGDECASPVSIDVIACEIEEPPLNSAWLPLSAPPYGTQRAQFKLQEPSGTILMATSLGLYVSHDDGASFCPRGHITGPDDERIRIRRVVAAETDPSPLYALTSEDTLYRTDDYGRSWSRIGPDYTWWYSTALAVDPNDPLRLLAGNHGGVVETRDGGRTWIEHPLRLRTPNIAVAIDAGGAAYVAPGSSDLVRLDPSTDAWVAADWGLPEWSGWESVTAEVDSGRAGTVYLMTPEGAYRTTNGGREWNPVGVPEDIVSMASDPWRSGTTYAVSDGPDSALYRTESGGDLWYRVQEALPPDFHLDGLTIDPNCPSKLHFVLGPRVWTSVDGGQTWSSPAWDATPPSSSVIATHPDAPETIYAAGLDGFGSRDGGTTWDVDEDAFKVGAIPLWAEDLAVHPVDQQTAYVAASNPLIEVFPKVAASSGAHTPLFETTDGGRSWRPLGVGAGFLTAHNIATDPSTPSRLWTAVRLLEDKGPPRDHVYVSSDGGGTWSPVGEGLPDGIVAELAVSPSSVYVAVAASLYVRSNGEDTWAAIGPTGEVTGLAVGSEEADTLYVVVDYSEVHRSIDSGLTWSSIGPAANPFPDSGVLSIAVAPFDADLVYVGTVDGIRWTGDGGQTWSSSGDALESAGLANSFAVGFDGSEVVAYAASTDAGILKAVGK